MAAPSKNKTGLVIGIVVLVIIIIAAVIYFKKQKEKKADEADKKAEAKTSVDPRTMRTAVMPEA